MILHRIKGIVENNAPDRTDMIGTKQWVFNNCLCGHQRPRWDSQTRGQRGQERISRNSQPGLLTVRALKYHEMQELST